MHQVKCPRCRGEKTIPLSKSNDPADETFYGLQPCRACHGTGEVMRADKPKHEENEPTLFDKIAG